MRSSQANRGRIWEEQLNRLHAQWASSGRAVVHRNYPEVKVKRDKKGSICGADFRGQGAPDFTIIAAGRVMVADAKSSQDPRWALRLLHPHQANSFDAVESQGGLSLLLINTPEGSWAVPWSAAGPRWRRWFTGKAERGEASLTAEWMTTHAIAHAPKGRILDYLQPALHHMRQRRAA